jgi:putative addiction module component (TIGR02574 family)
MSSTAEALKSQLGTLSPEDRAELASFLIDSLDPENDAEAEVAWDEELARREDDILSGRVEGESAASLFARLRKRLQ